MTTYNDQLSQYNMQLFSQHDEALKRAWEDTPKKGLPAIMQEFNRRVASDGRVFSTIYPAGDGTVLAVKVG